MPGVSHKKKLINFLLIASIITIAVFALLWLKENNELKNFRELKNKETLTLRAKFAAKSAIQHFKVKERLFQKEFYNALMVSAGKNPLFDFKEYPETDTNGEKVFTPLNYSNRAEVYIKVKPQREYGMRGMPRYFYTKHPTKKAFIKLGSFGNPDYRYLFSSEGPRKNKYTDPMKVSEDTEAFLMLNTFIKDCAKVYPAGITKLTKHIKDYEHDITKFYYINPYHMEYKIKKIETSDSEKLKDSKEEYCVIEAVGKAKNSQGTEQFTESCIFISTKPDL